MNRWGIAAGLLAAAIWGGMYVVSKVVLGVVPPFTLLSLRLLLGIACLGLIVVLTGRIHLRRAQVRSILFVGLLGYGVSIGLQFVGTRLTSAANASLVTSASPIFIMLFGVLILGERASLERGVALGLAFLGVLAVIDPRAASIHEPSFAGNLALLGAAVTWGLYSVLVRQVSHSARTVELSLIAFLGGLPVAIGMSVAERTRLPLGEVTPLVVAGILYLGVISTALAMFLWNKSLQLLEAGVVSILFFAQPVVGVGLGAWVLGEQLSRAFWLGAGLIGAGLVLAARASVPREVGEPPTSAGMSPTGRAR
ncbi:MAG: DMT family transporter [Anaerolineales bacterium]|nr:DMT family transporter [Anaerolineales bacterium]